MEDRSMKDDFRPHQKNSSESSNPSSAPYTGERREIKVELHQDSSKCVVERPVWSFSEFCPQPPELSLHDLVEPDSSLSDDRDDACSTTSSVDFRTGRRSTLLTDEDLSGILAWEKETECGASPRQFSMRWSVSCGRRRSSRRGPTECDAGSAHAEEGDKEERPTFITDEEYQADARQRFAKIRAKQGGRRHTMANAIGPAVGVEARR